jgi:hypothetical protein
VLVSASALLAAVYALVIPPAQAQKPLGPAENLDFEGPAEATGLPESWGGGGPEYELAIDKSVAHQGKQSGRVSYVGTGEPEKPGFGTLTQGISPDPFRGKRVRYSGYVRTKNVAGSAGLWMRVDGSEQGRSLSFDNMMDRGIVGTSDWKKYEIVLDVPKEATAIYFGMLVSGKGTAWVDDLHFEKVAPDTPVTDPNKRETAGNMDFEATFSGNRFPPSWGGGGAGYEITATKKAAHGGKQSGYIRRAKSESVEAGFGTLTQGVVADEFRGGSVRYTGYLRTEDVTGWAGLWLRVDGPAQGKPLAFDNMKTSHRAVVGTTDWKKYEIVLDVPEEATKIFFGMLLAGDGAAWVDDLKLEPAGPD